MFEGPVASAIKQGIVYEGATVEFGGKKYEVKRVLQNSLELMNPGGTEVQVVVYKDHIIKVLF